jgi:hypothetical protein
MALTDSRISVLGAINEVRRRAKLSPATTVDQDSESLTALSYLNDVVAELSDYGNWQETYSEANLTIATSVREYAVSGVVVQNIHEVSIEDRTAALRFVKLDDIRRYHRLNQVGEPNFWSVKGTNGEGNPVITFDRWPGSNENGKNVNIGYYQKPSVYTTADGSTVIPFPSRVIVQGLLTKMILDESDGEPTSRYQSNLDIYENMAQESYNRYNGDSGSTVFFKPGRR